MGLGEGEKSPEFAGVVFSLIYLSMWLVEQFNCLVWSILHIWTYMDMFMYGKHIYIYLHIYIYISIFIYIYIFLYIYMKNHEQLFRLNWWMMNTRLVWISILANMEATIHFGLPCPYRKLAHPCAHNPPWYPLPLEELLVFGVAWSKIPNDQVLKMNYPPCLKLAANPPENRPFAPNGNEHRIPSIYFQV